MLETNINSEHAGRQREMAILARAKFEEIEPLFEKISRKPKWNFIRKPETGLVMVKAKTGGSGAPFNFSEVTVTRAVVSLDSGENGYAYALGRDKKKAEVSAVIDALWQQDALQDEIEEVIIKPLEKAQQEKTQEIRDKTEATKVNFFTMVRGED